MNRFLSLAVLLLALSVTGARADWKDDLTLKPGPFPAQRPLKAHYKFGWGPFTAAEADFVFTRKNNIARLTASAKTIGTVRSMWQMDTEQVATMRAATLQPITLLQTETYKKETDKTRVTFGPASLSRLHEEIPKTGKEKVKIFKFPHVYDLHSALHFVRSQTLAAGDTYKFVTYPTTAPYLAALTVAGREKRQIGGTMYNTVKLNVRLQRIDKKLTLKPHEKFKRASVWLSDDTDRLLLRVEAEISVGSVWGELEKVDFPASK